MRNVPHAQAFKYAAADRRFRPSPFRSTYMKRQFGFLKTTALGGVLFLLPLIVIGALVGQAVPIVVAIAEFIGRIIPVSSAWGVALIMALAIGVCVMLCFLAGFIARLSMGRRLSHWMERNVLLIFPRYAVVRDQMAGSVGGGVIQSTLKPVLVTFDDHQVVAFESDRFITADHHPGRVVIYMPGAPDPWSGQIVFVEPHRVQPLDIEFSIAIDMCKGLGRDAAATLTPPSTPPKAVEPTSI